MIKKQSNAAATYRSLSSWKLSMTRGRAKVSSYWPNLDWIILENTIIKNKVVSNSKIQMQNILPDMQNKKRN